MPDNQETSVGASPDGCLMPLYWPATCTDKSTSSSVGFLTYGEAVDRADRSTECL